jgi:hypothetical protein
MKKQMLIALERKEMSFEGAYTLFKKNKPKANFEGFRRWLKINKIKFSEKSFFEFLKKKDKR